MHTVFKLTDLGERIEAAIDRNITFPQSALLRTINPDSLESLQSKVDALAWEMIDRDRSCIWGEGDHPHKLDTGERSPVFVVVLNAMRQSASSFSRSRSRKCRHVTVRSLRSSSSGTPARVHE